jgi:hypothetical protein
VIEDSSVRAEVEWVVTRAGVGHGLAAGFDRAVTEGVEISNAPDRPAQVRPTLVYEPVIFPWSAPVALEAGDTVSADIAASLLHDEYIWSWNTRIRSGRTGEPKAAFSQSTFLGTPLSLETLKKHRM